MHQVEVLGTSTRLGGIHNFFFAMHCVIVGGEVPAVTLFYNMIFTTVQAVKYFMTLSGGGGDHMQMS